MTPAQIYDILKKAGYLVPGKDGTFGTCREGFICITDPTCIWPPILNFIDVAWIILAAITGFLLAGWGITMVRGANHDMVKNLRTLILIFGTLSVAVPAMNALGFDDEIVSKCGLIEISQDEIDKLLEAYSSSIEDPSYEHFEILDSAFDNIDNAEDVSIDDI